MSARNLPATGSAVPMDPDVVAQVDALLAAVAGEHRVAVPWAVESGSRAWGFPSPDSDYDCRFLYVRRRASYLSPWRPRDVIETPPDPVLDVNGWDLVKAVDLAVRGNATLGEWLRSPLVYAGEQAFADELGELVAAVADPGTTVRHYVHVARDQWEAADVEAGRPVRLKRVLYAVRPVLALRWLEEHDGVPPMDVPTLVAQSGPPADVVAELEELVAAKALTREVGEAVVPAAIAAFVEDGLSRGFARLEGLPERDVEAARRIAEERFVAMLDRWAPA